MLSLRRTGSTDRQAQPEVNSLSRRADGSYSVQLEKNLNGSRSKATLSAPSVFLRDDEMAEFAALSPVELAGPEPATSWVRFHDWSGTHRL
jgi:hypothetical protein